MDFFVSFFVKSRIGYFLLLRQQTEGHLKLKSKANNKINKPQSLIKIYII